MGYAKIIQMFMGFSIINIYIHIYIYIPTIFLVGGFNPSEKYESQIGSSSQLLGKIKHVPNHQPVLDKGIMRNHGFLAKNRAPEDFPIQCWDIEASNQKFPNQFWIPSPWPSPPPSAGEPRPRVVFGVPSRRRVVARSVVNNGRHGARRGGPPTGVGFVNCFLAPVVYMHYIYIY